MSCCSARIGIFGIVTLVLLRITVGWHILYEGLWKHEQDDFSSDGYLSMASGPFGNYFHYEVMDDFENRKVLGVAENKARMDEYFKLFVRETRISGEQLQLAQARLDDRKAEVETLLTQKDEKKEIDNGEILKDHFANWDTLAKDREARKKAGSAAPFADQRIWEREQELRAEARPWIAKVEAVHKALHKDLKAVLPPDQQAMKIDYSIWEYIKAHDVDHIVIYANIAIGFCLMIGLFTRTAALGGAVFLGLIVAAKMQWPGYYSPPTHPAQGHSLLFVNKEFIEMMCLLALATLPTGRWGGVDFILHSIFVRPFCSRDKTPAVAR